MDFSEIPVRQLTKEQAISIADSREWESWSMAERARRQICQERLFMEFAAFHKAVEETLGRPVWTHEFGLNWRGLYRELMEGHEPPTMEDIIGLLPPDKTIVVVVDDEE